VVLKFFHVDSIADAENLRGFEVVIPREERMPLEGDAVYVSDLLGVRVIDVSRGAPR
jgi:16S rRNA processing protein RimM